MRAWKTKKHTSTKTSEEYLSPPPGGGGKGVNLDGTKPQRLKGSTSSPVTFVTLERGLNYSSLTFFVSGRVQVLVI